MRRSGYLLICAALVALAAGLWPWASRLYDERQRETQVRDRAATLAQEVAAQKNELAANKPRLLSEIKALQANGQHADVMKMAARYRLAEDADMHAVFVRSAENVSFQQLTARMEQLVAKSCTGIQALQTAGTALSILYPEIKQASSEGWQSERLDIAPRLGQIRGRLVQWSKPPAASTTKPTDPLGILRAAHTPRLLPQIQHTLLTSNDPSSLVCAWRVKGTLVDASQSTPVKRPFDMVIWFAPSANERMLEHDFLSLSL